MDISVIVPAYNSEKTLQRCLTALQESLKKDFELIIIDDGSSDSTSAIARRFTEQVYLLPENKGRSFARNLGKVKASGDILVMIDSDILVFPDTLGKIENFFLTHEDADAVTGCLSVEHPHNNFFSQYKNLYMSFIFSLLPEKVNFLYGSIHAFRKDIQEEYEIDREVGEDTELGQRLTFKGLNIYFRQELEVIHLKNYSFLSWLKNDFLVPFPWSRLFLYFRGWEQVGENGVGFAHAPIRQLLAIALLGIFIVYFFLLLVFDLNLVPLPAIALLWFLCHLSFFYFLGKQKGFLFMLFSIPVTFLDNIVMGTGIAVGFLKHTLENLFRRKSATQKQFSTQDD